MPSPSTNSAAATPAHDRERLRLRAADIQRQKAVLQNELQSPGISPEQNNFLDQRIRTLSSEEDQISLKMAALDRQIAESKKPAAATAPARHRNNQTGNAATIRERQSAAIQAQQISVRYERRRQDREEVYLKIRNRIKKTTISVVVITLAIAGLADLLSFVDLGWLVSWLLVILTWLIVRRINRINDSTKSIASAQRAAMTELNILQQRLRPVLQTKGQLQTYAELGRVQIAVTSSSYTATFLRDEAIAQLVELVPFLDWLPFYLGETVRVLIRQRAAYMKAMLMLKPYRQILDALNNLEDLELEQLGAMIQQPTSSRQARQKTPARTPVMRDVMPEWSPAAA